MLAFAAAVFLLIITPGPGVLSTAGVGAGFGFRPALSYVGGLFLGNLLVSFAVISGLAAVLFSVPFLRIVLLVCSTTYLLYLAGKIAFSGSNIAFIRADQPPGFMGGVLLQIINPKAYVVSTTLFSGFAFFPTNLAIEVGVKLIIFNVIWIPIHFAWLWAGVALNRLALKPQTQRAINYAMAMAMLAVVGIALVFSG